MIRCCCCCCCCSGQTGTDSEEKLKARRGEKDQLSLVLLLQVEQQRVVMEVLTMKSSRILPGSGAEPLSQIMQEPEQNRAER